MKFTSATAMAVMAVGAMGIPNPAPEPQPWCLRPGEPCWKAKRAVEVFANSVRSAGGIQARSDESDISNAPGGAAYAAKRAVNELANVVALSSENPAEYYASLGLHEQFEADEGVTEKRETAEEAWCKRIGQPCGIYKEEKRETSAEAWCKRIGQPCGIYKSDKATNDKRWCMRPGQPCWKAKRTADAVLEAIGDGNDADAADTNAFNPIAVVEKRGAWCPRPGEPCWKAKREAEAVAWCMRPGQPCWRAKRDLQAIRTVARSIAESFQ